MNNNKLRKGLLLSLEPDAQSVALSILKSLVLDNQVAEYQALHQRVMKSVDAGEDIFDLFDIEVTGYFCLRFAGKFNPHFLFM